MDKFCKECGGSITDSLNFCQHCGHKLEVTKEQPKEAAVNRVKQPRKYTKKQKIVMSSIAALLIIFAGFYIWGKSYTSPENTAERFVTALKDKDSKAVQDLTILNGSSISKAEAKALISLAKEGNDYFNLDTSNLAAFSTDNQLFNISENGKWLGIFTRYSVSLIPQYAAVNIPFDGVVSTFNGKDFPIVESNENQVVYGPMAPGSYKLNSSFSGEYTEVESDESIILADSYSDWVSHNVELGAAYVTLELFNNHGIPIKNAYITLNKKKIPFDENLMIESLGPLTLDGSVKVTPNVETDWGEVESESIALEDTYYEIGANTLSKTLMDELSDAILLYGEEYAKANASYDQSLFTNITDDMRETFQSNFDYYKGEGDYFSGQLDSIEVDFNDLRFDSDQHISVPAKFYFTSASHREGEEVELGERIDHCNVEIVFDSSSNQWLINSSYSVDSWFGDTFTATKTLEGSQKLYNASKTAVSTDDEVEASSTAAGNDIEEVTLNYVYKLVEAINANDYEIVRPYIKDGSALNKMQEELVDRLYESGMTQEVIDASIFNIEQSDGKWIVTTIETINLIYESGEVETKDYSWDYTVEQNEDGTVLVDME
ncbi:zinc ribbon domain-containing protein [Oceanobacillus chungangensis]|uniref:Zinc-ribbon domain-containing protein n=1 Tax=Oceanobacillus chungangensis TaxID=1229152 RepID=A0A3D8PGY9_9BACI|nr:hypothetical protein [Oceanobacillus chungangensis]RDW15344.1 hypothetical protein CWR45_16255 [Oceanobacillus chungangensis]